MNGRRSVLTTKKKKDRVNAEPLKGSVKNNTKRDRSNYNFSLKKLIALGISERTTS